MNHSANAPVHRRRLLAGAAAVAGGVVLGAGRAPGPAYAGVAAPRVYTRAEWEARPPSGAIEYLDRVPDHIVVHHTAGENTSDFSLAAAFRHSRWIQDLHMDRYGWADAGQQLTISRGGHVMEGRWLSLRAIWERQHVLGAHTAGHNEHTVGIENEGTYVTAEVPDALFAALVTTCAWLCAGYDLDPYTAIVGHRDYVTTTACPGDVLYDRLPELRRRVASRLDGRS
ncbi:N-acetylmuramoyl-L-alanine amidase [Krasilnikovia cinnamomea]|uniref:N-acetylmuramoyl-L-alanine amidase n=1 Tax=Krasilnikovia cinnamomea TaxID=349313 RepID=A0A4Q7ZRH5_9ACTN|nr:peptidoglycan recognition family protein [Krasilnikovia cinnamomea]RZU53747.1 N-acetylmuramoyl-L-alanine amidase [Krasilnikovia cinnamomea]